MSIDILTNYIISKNPSGEPFTPHATRHDLESLIWVTIYWLYLKIYQLFSHLAEDDPKRRAITGAFTAEFGDVTAEGVRMRRTSMMFNPKDSSLSGVLPFMDPVLQELTEELLLMVKYQNDVLSPEARSKIVENRKRIRSKEVQSRLELKRVDITYAELINQLDQSLAQCVSV